MSELSLRDLSDRMRDIDFAILMTRTESGAIAGRPMTNNAASDYQGDSYYFTWEQSRMVSDIEREPRVALSFQGDRGLLGRPPFLISVEGDAELIRDKAEFLVHWTRDLDDWFEQGVNTPGMVLIKVHAKRIHYWNGRTEGEILVA